MALLVGSGLLLSVLRSRSGADRGIEGGLRRQADEVLLDLPPGHPGAIEEELIDVVIGEVGRERCLWGDPIEEVHYPGYRPIVGEHLKCLSFLDVRVVGCLGWGGAAWNSRQRESFIGWSEQGKRKSPHLAASNVRFLILPRVRLPHLASKVLGAAARRIGKDREAVYSHPIYLLETFVDSHRFRSLCDRAANWTYLGDSEGSAKRGRGYYVPRADEFSAENWL